MFPVSILHVLLFVEAPGTPQSVEVADINKDSITVKWKPPVSDAGADVTDYVVEMKTTDDDQFTAVAEVQQGTNFYTATHLEEGQAYEFKIRAKNAAGTSQEAGELDFPVMAKAKVNTGRFYHISTR